MAWFTGQLTQNGNSTFTWTVSGPTQGLFDSIAVGRTAGNSPTTITRITSNGNVHSVTIQVLAPGAVSYVIRGGPVP